MIRNVASQPEGRGFESSQQWSAYAVLIAAPILRNDVIPLIKVTKIKKKVDGISCNLYRFDRVFRD